VAYKRLIQETYSDKKQINTWRKSMEIKTKEYSLTPFESFRILYYDSIKKILLALVILTIIGLIVNYKLLVIFIGIMPILIMIKCWRFVNSRENACYLKKRRIDINNKKLSVYRDDGELMEVLLTNIVKVLKRKQYYLIYIAKDSFLYLPISAFNSSKDINEFELLLKQINNAK